LGWKPALYVAKTARPEKDDQGKEESCLFLFTEGKVGPFRKTPGRR